MVLVVGGHGETVATVTVCAGPSLVGDVCSLLAGGMDASLWCVHPEVENCHRSEQRSINNTLQ